MTGLILPPWASMLREPNIIDDAKEWAKDVFDSLSRAIRKARIYVRRVPGGIKQMLRYIKDGKMYETSEIKEISWSEIIKQHDDQLIDDDVFDRLKSDIDVKVGDLDRDR